MTAVSEPSLSAALVEYRAYIRANLSHRSLFALASLVEDRGLPRGLDLLPLFIPPLVRQEIGDLAGISPFSAGALVGALGPVRPALDVLASAESPWVVITGSSGAGKTTLSQWLALALCAAEGAPPLLPGLGDGWVPLRVDLRHFDSVRQAQDVSFLDYVDQVHTTHGLALRGPMLRSLSAEGRLLWLFDALDEITEPTAQQRCADMIAALRGDGQGRGLVTTRAVGHLSLQGLPVYRLQDFEEEQVQRFIDRFHLQAFPDAPDLSQVRRERLLRALSQGSSLAALARNPLLLTLLCLLNRGAELPRRRHLILQRALELMLYQWEANKGGNPLELEDTLAFLQEIALNLLRRPPPLKKTPLGFTIVAERTYLDEPTLYAAALRFCQRSDTQSEEAAPEVAAALISYLRERAGILVPVEGGGVGFVHKIFLEYLAARQLWTRFASHRLSEDDLRTIFRERSRDGGWGVSLAILFGLLDEQGAAIRLALLQDAFRGGGELGGRVVGACYFALSCLAEVRHLDREPLRSFARLLSAVVEQTLVLHGQSATADADFLSWVILESHLRPLRGRWPDAREPRLPAPPERGELPYIPAEANEDPVRASFLHLGGFDVAEDTSRLSFLRDLMDPSPEGLAWRERLARGLVRDPPLPEMIRFSLARLCGTTGVPREALRPVFVDLARSAADEGIRLDAAMQIGDRDIVASLAAMAEQASVRHRASAALELERLREAILALGRLRRALVSLRGERVGVLEETRAGSRFTYDEAWLARPGALPISPTLPLRPDPYESDGLHPFFDNLLPEGWLLQRKSRQLKLDPADAFGLLLATGDDTIGAVDLRPDPAP